MDYRNLFGEFPALEYPEVWIGAGCRLDLHHHYPSEKMAERVRAALPGAGVELSGRKDDDRPFVVVGE
ncbi:hypothetical protein HNP84_006328 [Thermocatellispora tengchongensis]|uniref:Uncharacterized protein n=1 Tax=Thermocatellispora tengchongensis TaxID=1073253 RepID=A0A840PFG4_9ACTN|nr:hypothetical protein [Thermocatellispora tengchongensis]